MSATVKAYFALKVSGLPADCPELQRARERILALGGIQAANSYVKINLSLFGLYPRERCPSIPPEMMLLPGNCIYQMSSWTRAIVVPLAIVHARNPMRPVPADFDLSELFLPGGGGMTYLGGKSPLSWRSLFLAFDRLLKFWEKYGSQCAARPGDPQGRALDAGTYALHRRARRHLSSDDVHHHGAGCARLSAKPSAIRGGLGAVRPAAGGRRGAVLLPALLFRGLGHRDRRLCARRKRDGARGRPRQVSRLAPDQGGPAEGRLVRQAA